MPRSIPAAVLAAGVLAGGSSAHWEAVPGVSPLPLRGVVAIDALRCRTAGDGGVIAATKDGGRIWSVEPTGISEGLLSIDFVSPDSGWAVGEAGAAVATLDAGATWGRRTVVTDDIGLGPPDALTRVAATGPGSAWVLARWGALSQLLHGVADGPFTGIAYSDFGYRSPATVLDLAFVSDAEGWLLAMRLDESDRFIPVLLHTTSAGAAWERYDVPGGLFASAGAPGWRAALTAPAPDLAWLHLAEPSTGTARLFRLERDAGVGAWAWSSLPAPSDVSCACFLDARTGWLVGARTWQTRDGGTSFRVTDNPGLAPLTAASFVQPPEAGARPAGFAADRFGRAHRWVADRLGDVDGDGLVTLPDAVLLARAVGAGSTLDPETARLADVHPSSPDPQTPPGDGAVTLADAAALLEMAAGLRAEPVDTVRRSVHDEPSAR